MNVGGFASLALLGIAAGCGTEEAFQLKNHLFPMTAKSMVVFEVRGECPPPSGGEFMWTVFSQEESNFSDSIGGFLFAADSAEKLLLLVRQEPRTTLEGRRQHLDIGLDRPAAPVSIRPDGLAPELEGLFMTPDSAGQSVILGLFEKYRPDIVFISVDTPDRASMDATVAFWRNAALTKDFRLAVFSAPTPGRRGWCALAWRGLEPGFFPGLSFIGFMKTLRIIAGLPWDPSTASGIPAAAALAKDER